jgi:hypothetical protein
MQTSTGSDGGFATVGSQAGAQSAAAKCAIWSAWALAKAGRAVARATYPRQAG